MREIKFRGKTPDGEWVFGALDNANSEMPIIKTFDKSLPFISKIVKKETVGQYIGLADKNGNEIYEGDIYFKEDHFRGKFQRRTWFQFKFDQGGFCEEVIKAENDLKNPSTEIGVFKIGDQFGLSIRNGIIAVHIIGNIHDNPELLAAEELDSSENFQKEAQLKKYRTKLRIIEAVKLEETGKSFEEAYGFIGKNFDPYRATDGTFINIKTPKGTMRAYVGDYIIKVGNDELYPCKPDVFEESYELVE